MPIVTITKYTDDLSFEVFYEKISLFIEYASKSRILYVKLMDSDDSNITFLMGPEYFHHIEMLIPNFNVQSVSHMTLDTDKMRIVIPVSPNKIPTSVNIPSLIIHSV